MLTQASHLQRTGVSRNIVEWKLPKKTGVSSPWPSATEEMAESKTEEQSSTEYFIQGCSIEMCWIHVLGQKRTSVCELCHGKVSWIKNKPFRNFFFFSTQSKLNANRNLSVTVLVFLDSTAEVPHMRFHFWHAWLSAASKLNWRRVAEHSTREFRVQHDFRSERSLVLR